MDSEYAIPADHIRLGQGQFRNIFLPGEALTFPIYQGSGSIGSWEVIDHTGLTVATGGPATLNQGGTFTIPSALPTGWYRILFRRNGTLTGWGDSQGGGMFLITRQVTGMPPRPPINIDGAGTFIDAAYYWTTLTGPLRLDADVANPALQANQTAGEQQYATHYAPYDTTRPKPLLMAFAGGTETADPVQTTTNIGTIVNQYPTVTHFEAQNEPGGNPGAWYVPQMQRFYQNVKAARPGALVCGPCPVNIGGGGTSQLDAFFGAGGGQYLDVVSFHAYNGHNGDLMLGRKVFDGFNDLLTKHGLQNKPRMNTESGSQFGAEWGMGQIPRQAHRNLLDLMLHEQYGVQKESWSYFYPSSHGFWGYSSWVENDFLHPFAFVAQILTHSQELLGTAWEARLDFGTIDNQHLIGSSYRRANGTGVVALLSAGQADAQVTLQLTGGTAQTVVSLDGYGRTTTVPVVNGLVTVPVSTVARYVQLPAGITATPVPRPLGVSKLLTNTVATVSGPRYRLTDPKQVVQGPWRNALYFDSGNNGDGRSVFNSSTTPSDGAPVDFTVTFTEAFIDTVVVHCPPSWQWALSVIRNADLQVLVNGTWKTVKNFGYQPRLEKIDSGFEGVQGFAEVWDQDIHRFELTFDRVKASGIRLRVREVSAGGVATLEANNAFGATRQSDGAPLSAGMGSGSDSRLALQYVAAFDSGITAPTIAGTGKYVRLPDA